MPITVKLDDPEFTEEEFNGLIGRLDGELRKSEREAEELGLKPQTAPISELDLTEIKPLGRSRQYPERIFEVSSEDERITAQLNKSRSGKLAERATFWKENTPTAICRVRLQL